VDLHHTRDKICDFVDGPQANLGMEKTKPNTTKVHIHSPIKRNVLQHKINTKN